MNSKTQKLKNRMRTGSPASPGIRVSIWGRFRKRMNESQHRRQSFMMGGQLLDGHSESVSEISQFTLERLDLSLLGSHLAVKASAEFRCFHMTQKVKIQMYCDQAISC